MEVRQRPLCEGNDLLQIRINFKNHCRPENSPERRKQTGNKKVKKNEDVKRKEEKRKAGRKQKGRKKVNRKQEY
jgi:hypothetical protein